MPSYCPVSWTVFSLPLCRQWKVGTKIWWWTVGALFWWRIQFAQSAIDFIQFVREICITVVNGINTLLVLCYFTQTMPYRLRDIMNKVIIIIVSFCTLLLYIALCIAFRTCSFALRYSSVLRQTNATFFSASLYFIYVVNHGLSLP